MDGALITREQVIPLLIEACPSFQAVYDEHLRDHGEELLYLALGDFARHLLSLHQRNQVESFPIVALAIERLHVEGDSFVREAATIGLLEGIQNNWDHAEVDAELFGRHLLPVSAKWWRSAQDFWSGKCKFVGEGIDG